MCGSDFEFKCFTAVIFQSFILVFCLYSQYYFYCRCKPLFKWEQIDLMLFVTYNLLLVLFYCIHNKFIMAQFFKKDRKHWSRIQQQQAQYFFLCNEFFNKIYERQYFQQFVQLAYYAKITIENPLYLTDNKRPSAIILLKGNIQISKRQNRERKRKKLQAMAVKDENPEFIKIAQCLRYNQTIIQSSQCKVASLHGEEAEIIFVPSFLYNKFLQKFKQQKDKVIFNILSKIFKKAQNRYIMELAKSGCQIKQMRINNYIYEQGQKPESVFAIIEGSAKIQRPGFSYRNFQFVVVSTETLLGDKDLFLSHRQSSAVCCSAFIRLLQIPKDAFLRFAKTCLPEYKIPELKQTSSLSPSKSRKLSPKKQQWDKLPLIMRFRSAKKSQQEQMRQYNLIKNSHVLLQASKPSKKKIRSRSSYSQYPKDMMEQKLKLYKKLRPIQTKLDLSNRIF